MNKHLTRGFCALSKLLLGTSLLLLTVASNAQLNAVYVESNISKTNQNSVVGFSNDGFGNLTVLPKSPYLTQGTGWGVPQGQSLGFQADADSQIIVNNAGTLLFAVNGRSNTVSSFTINADGSLTLNGTPVNSGGSQPVSLAFYEGVLRNGNSLLAVLNKDSDTGQINPKPPSLVSMTVSPSGTMTSNLGRKITYAVGTSPSQLIASGNLLFIDQFMTSPSSIETYSLNTSNASFTKLSSIGGPPDTQVILGMALSPVSNYIYAALPADSLIAVYSFDASTGAMTLVSTVAGPGLLPCWLAINQAGTRLYSGDTESSSISVYDVSDPNNPTFLQQLVLSTSAGNGQPWNVKVDPTGQFLYAVAGVGLHAVNILSDGTLAELAPPTLMPVPAKSFPIGLATVLK